MGARVQLAEAGPEIIAALERLCAKPEALRPFVIVEAAGGGAFVQFIGDDRRMLKLDVPLVEQKFANGFAIEEVAHVDVETTAWGKLVQLDGTIQGAEIAQAILQHGFGLAPDVMLEIKEECTHAATRLT